MVGSTASSAAYAAASSHEIRAPISVAQWLARTPVILALIRLLIVATLFLLWEYLPVRPGLRLWLSSPSMIFQTLAAWFIDGSIWSHIGATLQAMLTGYVLGCAIGIMAGLTFGFMPRTYLVLAPYLSALYALPKVALVPLFILVLGIGIASKVALVVMTVFFYGGADVGRGLPAHFGYLKDHHWWQVARAGDSLGGGVHGARRAASKAFPAAGIIVAAVEALNRLVAGAAMASRRRGQQRRSPRGPIVTMTITRRDGRVRFADTLRSTVYRWWATPYGEPTSAEWQRLALPAAVG